jgi:ATP-dependent DNA helicase RecQ
VQNLNAILKQYWGYDTFRPLQQEAVASVLEQRDSLVVMPTGGGKSLCFQVPAVAMPGLAIVVSPLISLMKDQVDALRACGIGAASLNSFSTAEERREIFLGVRHGELKLLYVAPERLVTESFLEFLHTTEVSFIAIDEAHCISVWGHDFRKDYRGLSVLRSAFPGVGLHAYTASATPQVRTDIAVQLGLNNPTILVGSFDRPNLTYKVQRRGKTVDDVLAVLERHAGEAGIVYCIRRKEVDALWPELVRRGYRALPYHAGMDDAQRKQSQNAFASEKADIIVATVAFGMGIDKSNVRFIIHSGMPKSIEYYHQETGRAGRDGLEAECCLLYSYGDFKIWESILSGAEDDDARQAGLGKLNDMFRFCETPVCRHKAIVSHFGQAYDKPDCGGCCDFCQCDPEQEAGALDVAQKVLGCVLELGERFGAVYTMHVLAGANEERVIERRHDRLKTFGALQAHTPHAIRDWIEQLAGQGYLERTGEYNVLRVTERGWRVLRGEEVPRLLAAAPKPAKAPRPAKASKAAADGWENVDRGLFEVLRGVRRTLAGEQGVPPFVIFGDAALRDMARRKPTTLPQFLLAHGVGSQKCKAFGEMFTETIRQYCAERDLETDVAPGAPAPKPERKNPSTLTAARRAAFRLFADGASVIEVVQDIGQKQSTIAQYLVEYVQHENIVDPSPWVDEITEGQVREAIEAVGMDRLKPIFLYLEERVSYEHIRIVAACARNREGSHLREQGPE